MHIFDREACRAEGWTDFVAFTAMYKRSESYVSLARGVDLFPQGVTLRLSTGPMQTRLAQRCSSASFMFDGVPRGTTPRGVADYQW